MPDIYATYADHNRRKRSGDVWSAYVLFEQPSKQSHLYTVDCVPFRTDEEAYVFLNKQMALGTIDLSVNTPAVVEAEPTDYDSLILHLEIPAKSKLREIIDLDSLCNSLRKAAPIAYVSQLAAMQGYYYGK